MSKNYRNILISLLVLILLIGVGAGAYYLGQKQLNPQNTASQNTNTNPSQTVQNTEAQSNNKPDSVPKALFTGKIKKIDKDLGLILVDTDTFGKDPNLNNYYEAGVFNTGKFTGYTRIILVSNMQIGGNSAITYYFATKDNQNFTVLNYIKPASTLDKSLVSLAKIDPDASLFDSKKVTAVDYVDFEIPQVLKLDTNYGGKLNDVYAIRSANNFFDLVTDFSKLQKLKSTNINYDIYAEPYQKDTTEQTDSVQRDKLQDNYASFVAVDSAGLAFKYNLAWNTDLDNITSIENQFKIDVTRAEEYDKKRSDLQTQLSTTPNPTEEQAKAIDAQITKKLGSPILYPNIKTFDLSLNQSQIKLSPNTKIFDTYSVAFPGGCSLMGISTTNSIKDSDLLKVGSFNSVDIFKLSDVNSPFYKEEYNAKVNYYSGLDSTSQSGADETFSSMNPNTKKPTLQEYVAKNPLLFFKDPFNRLVVVGEYDLQLPGGCGKPVVYLYPSAPTKVNVKFLANIQLTTDIPKYVQSLGWNVLAKPDGELSDLQTQYTNCDIFNSPHAGSEYAKEACDKNIYPYLYWSGNRIGAQYPKLENGWIVEKKDLNNFLNAKLDEIGFNQKEKSDMLEYWTPYLNKKQGNYFRISFLQTRDMNQLAPMQITPTPNKVFRIFLDWDNYNSKPNTDIKPQILDRLTNRDGFTVVEWGGLKK